MRHPVGSWVRSRIGSASVAAALVVGLLAAVQAPAAAEVGYLPEHDLTVPAPQRPTGECEWYGELDRVERNASWNDEYQTFQQNTRRWRVSSTASTGEECGTIWAAGAKHHYTDVDPSDCTATWDYNDEGTGQGAGTLEVLIDSGPGGTAYAAVYGYGDPFPIVTNHTFTDCDTATTDVGSLDIVTDVVAGYCPAADLVGPDVQAFQFTCVDSSYGGSAAAGNKSLDTHTARFRRTHCDPTIDSDGGGTADCAEFDNRTDPSDPEDDDCRPDDEACTQVVAAFAETRTSTGATVFDATGSTLGATYSWSFGDGRTGSGLLTSHTYARPGDYQVTLTVSKGGRTATATRTVAVDWWDAIDDGTTVVRYPVGGRAPAAQRDLLANDIGRDKRIASIGTSHGGEAVALDPFAEGGMVRYAPRSPAFAGDDTVGYGIRGDSDPVGVVRDTAAWRLRYLQCRQHSLKAESVNAGAGRAKYTATGSLRVCSDGVRVYTDDGAASGKVNDALLTKAFESAITQATRVVTRGAVSYSIHRDWRTSKRGSSTVSVQLIQCDQWTLGAKFFLSKKNKKRLVKTLTKLVRSKKAATRLVDRLVKHDVRLRCHTELSLLAQAATLTSGGYEIWVTASAGGPKKVQVPLRRVTLDGRRFPAYDGTRLYTISCPMYYDNSDGALTMTRCGSRRRT